MMAAASCSVGIIPFHRPCLPYLDLSFAASDLVGSPRPSRVYVSSLAWFASASSRYPVLVGKRMAPIEISSGKISFGVLFYAAQLGALHFSIFVSSSQFAVNIRATSVFKEQKLFRTRRETLLQGR